MRRKHYENPIFEAIIYDSQDTASSDPSSTLGWFETLTSAMEAIYAYVQGYSGKIERFEIRDRTGKLHLSGNTEAKS